MQPESADLTPSPERPNAASCDVAVVGAGAVGLVAALAFARAGFETCLVGRFTPQADGRTVALLGDSVAFLRELGAWPRLAAQAAPLRIMQIVDDVGGLLRSPPARFAADEIGAAEFGYNIATDALLLGLEGAAGAAHNLSWPREGVTALRVGARPVLSLADGSSLTAGLVIGADGRGSLVRAKAGITARTWSYQQAALTTILGHERDHQDTSTEFHTRFGPFTLVPLPGRRSSLVWVTHPRHAARLMALDDAALAGAVETQAQSLLGAMRIEGARAKVPIGGLSVSRLHADGIALVGEAAHVLPPIGAQGLNLGLCDVEVLREVAVKARGAGEPIGADEVLRRYGSARLADIRLRTGSVDLLNRSLLTSIGPAQMARSLGFLAAGQIGWLRRALMREGLAGRRDPEAAWIPRR